MTFFCIFRYAFQHSITIIILYGYLHTIPLRCKIAGMRATKAIIHLDNFKHNIETIKKYTGGKVPLCIPVKADAYGHGAVTIARTAVECGVRYLAVAAVSEAVELRQAGISVPLLVLSIPFPSELPLIAEYNLTPLVTDVEIVRSLNQVAADANTTIGVHLKIDTGMGRIGCFPDTASSLAQRIAESSNVTLDGVCTHFPVADSRAVDDIAFTRKQITAFSEAVESIRSAGVNPGIVHAASSGGILCHPNSYFDMIRPGILVYGYVPDISLTGMIDVLPVMELVSYLSSVRFVPKNTSVSYGRTWIAPQDTWIGTVPVGYGDGWRRQLGNNVSVEINGTMYPVVGRVCMDQCMVDLGSTLHVQRWDSVTLFGPRSGNTAATLADQLDTIPYEITCSIAHRVPRDYQP